MSNTTPMEKSIKYRAKSEEKVTHFKRKNFSLQDTKRQKMQHWKGIKERWTSGREQSIGQKEANMTSKVRKVTDLNNSKCKK